MHEVDMTESRVAQFLPKPKHIHTVQLVRNSDGSRGQSPRRPNAWFYH